MRKPILLIILVITSQFVLYSQSCLPDGITFTTQEQIDNFQNDYPDCTEIEGSVLVEGEGIWDLDSLITLTSINGDLEIIHCYNLHDFFGLDSLEFIGGNLLIWYSLIYEFNGLGNLEIIEGDLIIKRGNALHNFLGLESLSTIGGGLYIGGSDGGIPSMTSLDGLENITSLGGNLEIRSNDNLTNLNGIINIDGTTIQNLMIYDNKSLSTCHVESICEYLVAPNGFIYIYENASGCNTQEEVEFNCGVSVSEISISNQLSTYPNPFTSSTTFKYTLQQPSSVQITIFNHLGEQVEEIHKEQSLGEQQSTWNAENFPPGVYYYRMQADEQFASGKIILNR